MGRKKTNKKGIKETGAEKIQPAQAAETRLAEMCCCVFGEEQKEAKSKVIDMNILGGKKWQLVFNKHLSFTYSNKTRVIN